MRRSTFVYLMFGSALISAGVVWHACSVAQTGLPIPPANKQQKPADSPLPIRQVILFNSGVGYFQREGEIAGTARLNLTFNIGDINDLLKSLVLQDLGGGRVNTVHFDSQDPLDKILHSFALDLNANPTFGQILNQARGEKVEVLRRDKPDAAPTKLAKRARPSPISTSRKASMPSPRVTTSATTSSMPSTRRSRCPGKSRPCCPSSTAPSKARR